MNQLIDEIQQDYFQNMELVNRVLEKISEYELITKLVSKMGKEQVTDALSQYISEEVQQYINERCQKGYKTHATRKTKKMFGRTYRNCVKAEEKDPAKGTGKKPKGSGRRLYTDEDPSDTVAVKFSSVSDIQDTFSKTSFKNKSHKRQSQIINLVHQRVRAAYNNAKDPETKARLKKAFDYAKKRKEASKEKTKRMKKMTNEDIDQIIEEEINKFLEEKKDACYHKVKSRYKVWPSAYASGALVKCRKVGAKNWGNKSKKK